jgi:hypothetical protein
LPPSPFSSPSLIDGIADERRIAQQRQGDGRQLAGNLLAGCWLPVLVLVATLVTLAAVGLSG